MVGKRKASSREKVNYTLLNVACRLGERKPYHQLHDQQRFAMTFHFVDSRATGRKIYQLFDYRETDQKYLPLVWSTSSGWAGPALSVFLLFRYDYLGLHYNFRPKQMIAFRLYLQQELETVHLVGRVCYIMKRNK